MSICRPSYDDFQCDLYVYESYVGGYRIHVAGRRHVLPRPLPPKVEVDPKKPETLQAWVDRQRKVSALIDSSSMEPITLPYAGGTFDEPTPEDLLVRLLELRAIGYRFPDYVLDVVREDIAMGQRGQSEGP